MRTANSQLHPKLDLLFILTVCLLLVERISGDARTQTVKIICGGPPAHNSSIFVLNFGASMENLDQKIRNSSSYAVATTHTEDAPDGHYGFAQCYGDLDPADCISCFCEARQMVEGCYPRTSGRVYLDGCYLRSDNYSFFHEYQRPDDMVVCDNTTWMGSNFEASARQALTQAAADGLSNGGYARIELTRGDNDSAYVLADCWKTLDASYCKACLENASAMMSGCLPWSEGRVLNAGCFMRYSNRDFFNRIPASKISKATVIIEASVSIFFLFLVGGVIIVFYKRKRRYIQEKRRGYDARKLRDTLHNKKLDFKYSTLERATSYFNDANKLGQGGFGAVYKGLLPDGREIAVKRLFLNNRQRATDFYNEVNTISSVEHKNLVKLLGCSCSGPESLLVYEFLPNKSLDNFIFDQSKGKELNWEKRYEIIVGIAEGLVYLHENSEIKIIHRDIKASNILLDSRLCAKIADFGLARTFEEDKSHISTAVAGTLGYMAPEYITHGKLTEKADVYSFGVLLLEMVTGKQNNKTSSSEDTGDTLITKAWKHFQAEIVEELYDHNLELQNYHDGNVKIQILRVVHIALLCTQEIPSLRPRMSKTLQMLTTDEKLPAPTSPPFISGRSLEPNETCEDPSDTFQAGSSGTVAGMSNSSFYPR